MNLSPRGNLIRRQILRDVKHHPNDIAAHISAIFSISRQAVNRHLKKLVDEHWLEASGTTRNKTYKLGQRREHSFRFEITKDSSEHSIYLKEFAWVVDGLKKNVDDIIFYGFTEMVNNAIDHSQGTECYISMKREPDFVFISIQDNGEGIFKRITRINGLVDERQALLELYKGKLTTDPTNHSGQGIFFTSRMFDSFLIVSGEITFSHHHEIEWDFLDGYNSKAPKDGTLIIMKISTNSERVDKEIFDQFTGDDDGNYAFNKTIIPVDMARFDKENLVSRSQAKRLLVRIENFKYILFDFNNVESIGQAFADEIFRVYRLRHPDLIITYTNANELVTGMIKRAEADLLAVQSD